MSVEVDVYVIHRGKQVGPFSVVELKRQVASGNIARNAPIWFKGLEDWTPLKSVFAREIEIEDAPRAEAAATAAAGKGNWRLPNRPPAIPSGADKRGWSGPSAGAGKLFVPGAERKVAQIPEEEAPPEWKASVGTRLGIGFKARLKTFPYGMALRILVVIGLGFAIYRLSLQQW